MIAFGAMIGWAGLYRPEDGFEKGGVVGAALGFAIGGVMIFFRRSYLCRAYGGYATVWRGTCLQSQGNGSGWFIRVYMGDHSWICRRYMF